MPACRLEPRDVLPRFTAARAKRRTAGRGAARGLPLVQVANHRRRGQGAKRHRLLALHRMWRRLEPGPHRRACSAQLAGLITGQAGLGEPALPIEPGRQRMTDGEKACSTRSCGDAVPLVSIDQTFAPPTPTIW